jgi:hypothetical protein
MRKSAVKYIVFLAMSLTFFGTGTFTYAGYVCSTTVYPPVGHCGEGGCISTIGSSRSRCEDWGLAGSGGNKDANVCSTGELLGACGGSPCTLDKTASTTYRCSYPNCYISKCGGDAAGSCPDGFACAQRGVSGNFCIMVDSCTKFLGEACDPGTLCHPNPGSKTWLDTKNSVLGNGNAGGLKCAPTSSDPNSVRICSYCSVLAGSPDDKGCWVSGARDQNISCCDPSYTCEGTNGGSQGLCKQIPAITRCPGGGNLFDLTQLCNNDTDCASGVCSGTPSRCQPKTVGADCDPTIPSNCQCGTSASCMYSSSGGGYTCQAGSCIPEGSATSCSTLGDPLGWGNCCQQIAADRHIICNSSNRCVWDGNTCLTAGATCTSGSTDCCKSANLSCQNSGAGTWTCSVTNMAGTPCTTEGACGTSGGECKPGFKCTGGACVAVSAADPCVLSLSNTYNTYLNSFDSLLAAIYRLLFPIGIVLGVFFIVLAGYKIMVSEGNPQKVKEGQEELTAAVLGTLFILLSVVLLRIIIKSILGVTVGF